MDYMEKFKFSNLPNQILVRGNFDDSCEVSLSKLTLENINKGILKVRIMQQGRKPSISSVSIELSCLTGNVQICIGNDGSRVIFKKASSGVYDVRLWRKSEVIIGEYTTSNGTKIICDNSSFICGDDCMFSDDILVQTADQHGIVDLNKGQIVNNEVNTVRLGDHVWLGRKTTLTANIEIGSGSVIGTCGVVTSNIPSKVIAAGVPAKIIKRGYTWSRSAEQLDSYSVQYISDFNS